VKKRGKKKRLIIAGIIVVMLALFLSLPFVFHVPVFQRLRYYFDKIEFRLRQHDNKNLSISENFDIYGIDISRHNGKINWDKVKKEGRINGKHVIFAIIKASEGRKLKDKKYRYNRKNARRCGIITGAYHFYRPEVNSMEQFENFKKAARLVKGDLPPVLDIEKRGNLSYGRYTQGILNLLKLMENHYGATPVIYASPALYSTLMRKQEFHRYPVWIATYNRRIPKKYKDKIFIVQYSEKGRVAGIKHYVDLNGFKGNKFDFQKYLIK